MILLTQSLNAWGSPAFDSILKREIVQLGVTHLPLQQGLSSTSHALDDKLDVMIISVADEAGCLRVKTGVFYSGIIPGCSCADDPTPIEEQNEYCVMRFDIDKATAQTSITLLEE